MRWLLIILAATAAIGISWIAFGRTISLWADRVSTVQVTVLPVGAMSFSNGTLQIGERSLYLLPAGSDDSSGVTVRRDARGHFVLASAGKTFPLGANDVFAPEAGDHVSYTIERSRFSWPTPFEMNFMTGWSPTWKRYLYHRFVWKKAGGAKVEIVSRYEQWFYRANGWTGLEGMTSLKSTGVARVVITQ